MKNDMKPLVLYWEFDRYNKGKLMAEDAKVRAENYNEALEKAKNLFREDLLTNQFILRCAYPIPQLDLRAELATALGVPAEVVTVENIKKAIENLGFYGNISDYKAPYTGGLGKLYFDCGEKARDGLAPFQTGK
jgi:hypothetical protein